MEPDVNTPSSATDYSHHTSNESVVEDMYYQKAVNDRKEVDAGTRFFDTGVRIPGAQAGKNAAYMEKRGRDLYGNVK